MDVKKAIEGRRTYRKFKGNKIDDAVLRDILKAGLNCPSACNQQMTYFIQINDEVKKVLQEEANFQQISRSPNVVFVINDKRFNNVQYANIQSAAAAVQNMLLYAHALGIGTCWMANVGNQNKVRKILNIPKHYHLLGAVGFGYPDEDILIPHKRNLNEVLFYNKFEAPSFSLDPKNWPKQEIWNLAARSIFAKSPDIGYIHLLEKQFENECKFIASKLGENVLSMFESSGLYIFKLAKLRPDVHFSCLLGEEYVRDWFKKRSEFLNIKNINFILDCKESKFEKEFDNILYLDILNRFSVDANKHILNKFVQFLDSKGTLIILFLNKFSLFGLLFRKGLGRRYGPEISYSYKKVKNVIKYINLNVEKRIGFNLLPSGKLFSKIGVLINFKLVNNILRKIRKYPFLEGSSTKNFMTNFCTSQIVMCRKQKNKINQ